MNIALTDGIIDEFYERAAATPSKIKPYWTKNQELHPENHKKIIHVFNTESMYHFIFDHTHDLVVFFHNGSEEKSQQCMKRFEMAVKYVMKMSSKKPRLRFATLDCEQNDCHHVLMPTKRYPTFVYYKPWEHTSPAILDENHFDSDGLLPVGEMVQLIHFEYTESEREILKHDDHLKKAGEKRVGPGSAHLHEYEKYKKYHEHSLEEHMKSGELHEEAKVPFWPQNHENDGLLHHHNDVDFNFNFDL